MNAIKRIRSRFVDIKEAAEILGLSPQRVGQLIRERQIKAYKVWDGKQIMLRSDIIVMKRGKK